MHFSCSLLLAVAQALRAKTLDNDSHGVLVQELNFDADYRDFNETVDSVTEANRKALSHVVNGTIGHETKYYSDNVDLNMEHDVFPMNNLTHELREDCAGAGDCSHSGKMYGWVDTYLFSKLFLFLSVAAMTVGLLVILTALKLKLSMIRKRDYSPALIEDRGYDLPVYQTNIH